MIVLVCGGRNFADKARLFSTLDQLHRQHPVQSLINGSAPGADSLASEWARSRLVSVRTFPADWNGYGRAAGPIRNSQMLNEGKPDLVVAFPGGNGTSDMIRKALAAGVKVMHA